MTYYGFVDKKVTELWKIYWFLQNALKLISQENPYRWPKKYDEDNLKYENNFSWKIDNFTWIEKIFLDWKKVYEASYTWWFIDL
jgi:hypothetical protein